MPDPYFIFGGSKPFTPPSWTTTDDRIRGGSSQSYLTAHENNGASFYGTLDIKTLGGAGFASQFSPSKDDEQEKQASNGEYTFQDTWDLSAYDGIEIHHGKGDGKIYTLILRDEKSPGKRDDGREKSSINWEVDLEAKGDGGRVWKPWKEFKATFRGKEKEDAGSLKMGQIQRVGIMMRSYFGTQEGAFRLELKSISARKEVEASSL